MYDSMGRKYCWPHMENEVYTTVRDYLKCARKSRQESDDASYYYSPQAAYWNLAQWDILGLLHKTLSGSQFVLLRSHRYPKLKRAVLMSKTTVLHIASLFLDKWVIKYGTPEYIRTNNGPQFFTKVSSRFAPF